MKCDARKSPAGRGRFIVKFGAAVLLATFFAQSAQGEASDPDPCDLLTDETIVNVQGASVSERVASTQNAPGFRVLQCLFKTSDLSSSVSVALTLDDGGGSALRYWEERFHVAAESGEAKSGEAKDGPPKSVPDLGDEAYWVGDPFSGALYVLAGDRFLRISVGGVTDEDARLRRCRALAAAAMSRNPAGRVDDPLQG